MKEIATDSLLSNFDRTNLRVLVVEDDLNFFKLLSIRLRSWCPEVTIVHANTIADSKARLIEDSFQLIILDQNLPDGLGVELLSLPNVKRSVVLAMSSDHQPEMQKRAIAGGAQYFLPKDQLAQPLFLPLLEALLERAHVEQELLALRLQATEMRAIRMLVSTLRHEINNPLGAVIGATYLLGDLQGLAPEDKEMVNLVQQSGARIKEVVESLLRSVENRGQLPQKVEKGGEYLYHIPGDPEWGAKKNNENNSKK